MLVLPGSVGSLAGVVVHLELQFYVVLSPLRQREVQCRVGEAVTGPVVDPELVADEVTSANVSFVSR